jgi:hypothetical protein
MSKLAHAVTFTRTCIILTVQSCLIKRCFQSNAEAISHVVAIQLCRDRELERHVAKASSCSSSPAPQAQHRRALCFNVMKFMTALTFLTTRKVEGPRPYCKGLAMHPLKHGLPRTNTPLHACVWEYSTRQFSCLNAAAACKRLQIDEASHINGLVQRTWRNVP